MRKKLWSAVAIALSAAIAGGIVYSRSASSKEAVPHAYPPLKVALATVQRGSMASAYSGVGELEAARQVQLAAEVAGRVTRIHFESGQQVKAGQILLQLNDAPEQADLLRRQAQLRHAEAVLGRSRKLLQENAATREQLDSALAARDMALGELRQTEAAIAQKTIRAPFAGQLGIRKVHEGQYLNPADAVASLIDTRTLYVNFSLEEQSSPQLALGQPVRVTLDAYPGRTFTARISALEPLIARSRTLQLQATLANPDGGLKAGMYASIKVPRTDSAEVLTVPETAITYTAYGDTVFVAARNDKQLLVVKKVAVKTGERAEGRVVIASGLRERQQVVTSGQVKLSDGAQVEAVKHDTLAQTAS
ncbi:efflux RND transporter periplasmic adaptor subunit [Janthinobacterium agaricidamnosum]|uniref:Efflux transporter, RND family, MFP subunit n=1 Tax=Janthinobacterium agaricidamnosum NBRC 102515 = DSM 9628 TaxID=1349767 RepID=W0V0M8_9BURK|nr:efflux RND transporter periplasmic adaptor subunit [Janthinobacterium agaricidamnosum]CDG80842.1 efflux transporter, RND family, MFP subunit [Janthinobacterium agaricidamnosum NBRC 102515 = DSM 9628]